MLTDDDKQWLSERLQKELQKELQKLQSQFSDQLHKVETQFSERLEKVETTLLTEFHKWASPVELRQKSHAAALRALDVEVESLSDRLKNLEGR